MKLRLSKLCALSLSLALLFGSTAQAAYLPLSKPYYTQQFNSGRGSFTIPYSGYYKITCAAGYGASAGTATGGGGEYYFEEMFLEKGDVVSYVVGAAGTVRVSGSSLYVGAGGDSSVTVNNASIASCRGGSGAVKGCVTQEVSSVVVSTTSSSSITKSVHLCHTEDGTIVASGPIYSTTKPGGCYTKGSHTHNAPGLTACDVEYKYGHVCDSKCKHWEEDVYYSDGCVHCNSSDGTEYNEGAPCKGHKETVWDHSDNIGVTDTIWKCGTPKNTWAKGCKTKHGQVEDTVTPQINGTNKGGNGYFKIQLSECSNLKVNGKVIKSPRLNSKYFNVVVVDDRVVFCKYGS